MSAPPAREIVVSPRFCGPPRSANGGYIAGRLAAFVPHDADTVPEITLRSPPPLGVRLVVSDDDEGIALHSPQTLVAQAKAVQLTAPPPAPVQFDEAVEAADRYPGRRYHPFPTCFACGLDRARGDGLRLQPGTVGPFPGPARVAAAWQPHESLEDDGRPGQLVDPEFVWAALDCPGGWATTTQARPVVLGRMSARLLGRPKIGQQCVIVGQLSGVDGRKAFTTSALYSAEGELLAYAEATWLAIDPATVRPAEG